jgi:hypothetical protein
MSLAKAYLKLRQPPAAANGEPGGQIGQIDFTFNPKELTVKRSAKYEAKASKKNQPPAYVGLEPGVISVEVFLDKELSGDVPKAVDRLFDCMQPVPKGKDRNPSPAYVTFGWGSLTYLTGQVKSVTAKYTLFDNSGTPIRAVCTIEIQEAKRGPAKTNPTSGGLVPRSVHVLAQGDTLMSVAYEEYGRPSYWRAVAAANGIDDPLSVPIGTILLLPTSTDAAGLS